MKKLLAWLKQRIEKRHNELAELDYRNGCDRAALREQHWYGQRFSERQEG